jgi:hypothetical protein
MVNHYNLWFMTLPNQNLQVCNAHLRATDSPHLPCLFKGCNHWFSKIYSLWKHTRTHHCAPDSDPAPNASGSDNESLASPSARLYHPWSGQQPTLLPISSPHTNYALMFVILSSPSPKDLGPHPSHPCSPLPEFFHLIPSTPQPFAGDGDSVLQSPDFLDSPLSNSSYSRYIWLHPFSNLLPLYSPTSDLISSSEEPSPHLNDPHFTFSLVPSLPYYDLYDEFRYQGGDQEGSSGHLSSPQASSPLPEDNHNQTQSMKVFHPLLNGA